VTVPAGQTVTKTVTVERPRAERLQLTDVTGEHLDQMIQGGEISAEAKDAFAKLMQLRAAATDAERKVAALDEERASVSADQKRLRTNLAALPKDSDLLRRTLSRMGEAETRLEALDKDRTAAAKQAETAKAAVSAFIRTLKL